LKKNSSTQFAEPDTSLKKLLSIRHTVAFRLALMYAGVFTISLNIVFWIFYVIVLYGSHGLSKKALAAIREDFREYLAWPLLFVIILSALVGWFMARRALSGVVQLTRTAKAVADGALKERVPVKGRQDEIDRLAMTFNTMLDRISALIQGMKETNDSIAHDLRSPIARMRGIAEAALTSESSSEAHRMLAGDIIEQCDRLLAMINTVLDISEAEAGVAKLVIEEVDLIPLVQDAVGLFLPMAEDKHIAVKVQAPSGARFFSDRRKLQRILGNLLDNAIKFTPPGGAITISVSGDDKRVLIGVGDTGIGISEKDVSQIFEKFFRADKSRSEPGSGLGLSLARAFVSSLGGSIAATSVPGEGSAFTVILPYRPASEKA
jgi:signal transduction histidine kinase